MTVTASTLIQIHWEGSYKLEDLPTLMNDEVWSTYIDLAEQLLIYTHKPAYNARSIATFPDKELQGIHVLNWGHYGHCFRKCQDYAGRASWMT